MTLKILFLNVLGPHFRIVYDTCNLKTAEETGKRKSSVALEISVENGKRSSSCSPSPGPHPPVGQ